MNTVAGMVEKPFNISVKGKFHSTYQGYVLEAMIGPYGLWHKF